MKNFEIDGFSNKVIPIADNEDMSKHFYYFGRFYWWKGKWSIQIFLIFVYFCIKKITLYMSFTGGKVIFYSRAGVFGNLLASEKKEQY